MPPKRNRKLRLTITQDNLGFCLYFGSEPSNPSKAFRVLAPKSRKGRAAVHQIVRNIAFSHLVRCGIIHDYSKVPYTVSGTDTPVGLRRIEKAIRDYVQAIDRGSIKPPKQSK